MATVRELQKRIVQAIEAGRDPAPILKELAEFRASLVMEADRAEMQKIADARQALRDKAEAVKARAQKQGAAIDAFLEARDTLVKQLEPLMEPAKELAQMGSPSWSDRHGTPGECYIFNDVREFQAAARDIPAELLPADFKCPTLDMAIPSEMSFGMADKAAAYLVWCVGILTNFRKGSMTQSGARTADSLLLDNETPESGCVVCQHPEVKAINSLLGQGKPLRAIETEFDISRSSLSRHRNRCLSLGVIKVERESPTASANATFFQG